MDIYIIIIILALSTEVFVSIFINEFLKNARLSQILKTALIIALVSMIMAGFGILLGHEVKKLLYNIYDFLCTRIKNAFETLQKQITLHDSRPNPNKNIIYTFTHFWHKCFFSRTCIDRKQFSND